MNDPNRVSKLFKVSTLISDDVFLVKTCKLRWSQVTLIFNGRTSKIHITINHLWIFFPNNFHCYYKLRQLLLLRIGVELLQIGAVITNPSRFFTNRSKYYKSIRRVARNFWGQRRFLQIRAQIFGRFESLM